MTLPLLIGTVFVYPKANTFLCTRAQRTDHQANPAWMLHFASLSVAFRSACMTEHPRRRAEDKHDSDEAKRSPPPDQQSPAPKRAAREFFHRFRQPLIGLGLAGLATPLIHREDAVKREEPADQDQATAPESAAEEKAPVEDRVAGQIAETHAADVREDTVRYAIDRYGIDRDLAEDIYDVATSHDIEPRLAFGLVKVESAFDHGAISHVGARGLTQVMPRTARWLLPGTRAHDLHDRDLNLNLGFRYLNQLINKYDGNVELALLAYNRGPGTVDRILKRGGNPDNGYARKVLRG
jgi:soluble lytic murein transglycosylase-like protein